ncbi:MAG TPA: universal stress protein [Pseudacidobacterium sp.]|nr:universal stress protein [Pseudacidobacterium sp.]
MSTADELREPNILLRNILFAMDFSPDSLRAFPFAVAIALHSRGKVFVAHIVPGKGGETATLKERASLDKLLEIATEMGLNDSPGRLRDVPHEVLVDHGGISARLLATADKCKIDLVVIGTHGWRGIRKLLKGSSAQEIACLATRPVLAVGPGVSGQFDFKLILYVTDFLPSSIHALPYAVSLAQGYGAKLLVLHVNDSDSHEKPIEAAAKTSEFLGEYLTGYAMNVTPGKSNVIVDFGPRADLIVEHATRRQVNLIVMGLHHLGSIKARIASHLPGSIPYEVISKASCPVLIVPST